MDNAQRELRKWLCHGRETGGEQKLCLEIAGEAQAEAEADKELRVVLRLSAKGIPVYEMVQEIPAGERPDDADVAASDPVAGPGLGTAPGRGGASAERGFLFLGQRKRWAG